MKNLQSAIQENNLQLFKEECTKTYLNDKNVLTILKKTIKEKKLDFFEYALNCYLNPEVFWTTHKELLKNPDYDCLRIMIKTNRNSETEKSKKNSYANELLFNFIAKDDLFFVSYLVEKEKASTENYDESELSVLSECSQYNAIKCFDYFLSKNKNVHDYDDIALFHALDKKHYSIVSLILNKDNKIDDIIAQYFFKYGTKNNQETTNKLFLSLVKIAEPAIEVNSTLQNALNYQYIKRGYLKQLEENLKKGHSPIGDEKNELMGLAIMLRNNSMKTTKLLLDYGGIITDDHKNKLSIDEASELENYPRYSKIKENLEKKLPSKGKTVFNKI